MTATRPDFFDRWRRFGAWIADNYLEILSAIGLGILIVLALIGLRGLGRRLMGRAQATGWRKTLEGIFARTYLFFIVMAAAKLVSLQLDLPRRAEDAINILFIIAAALQVAIWTRALVIGAIENRLGDGEGSRNLGTAMGLIRVLVTVAAFLIAIIVILDNVGVDVTALVAGLGIGGIAIGLAAQGIFSDLFAALAIIFDRPFRKGDTINVGGGLTGQIGTVEHIGLKTTRLRALDGELVAYGNAELLKQRLHNYALQERRRVVMLLGVRYETAPDLLAAIPGEIKAIVEAQEQTTFDRSHMIAFAPSSIDFETAYFVETGDFNTFADIRHAVLLAIVRRFAELGIQHGYPTQTTYTAGPDGQLVMPWPPTMAVK